MSTPLRLRNSPISGKGGQETTSITSTSSVGPIDSMKRLVGALHELEALLRDGSPRRPMRPETQKALEAALVRQLGPALGTAIATVRDAGAVEEGHYLRGSHVTSMMPRAVIPEALPVQTPLWLSPRSRARQLVSQPSGIFTGRDTPPHQQPPTSIFRVKSPPNRTPPVDRVTSPQKRAPVPLARSPEPAWEPVRVIEATPQSLPPRPVQPSPSGPQGEVGPMLRERILGPLGAGPVVDGYVNTQVVGLTIRRFLRLSDSDVNALLPGAPDMALDVAATAALLDVRRQVSSLIRSHWLDVASGAKGAVL